MLVRRMLIMVGLVVVVVAALAAYKGYSIYQQIQMFTAPKPAISVSAATAREIPWQGRLPAIGTLKALEGVELTAEVGGIVRELKFDSGQRVEKGQPLVLLDSDVERASLATAEAERGLAQVEFERGRSLVNRQSISKSEFDRLSAALQKANASVAQLNAQLAKKNILAPFSGTIGIRQIDVGSYLSPGSPIASLQNLSELHVDFFLPEQQAPQVQVGQRVLVGVAAFSDEEFEARITAINPRVESDTRNLQVRATLENREGRLLPGMFANLYVVAEQSEPSIVVPETAITYTLYGNSVYVINEQADEDKPEDKRLIAERRFVETGERRDGRVVILKGLKAGEQVVTSGQLKLDNGAHVAIADDPVQPDTAN